MPAFPTSLKLRGAQRRHDKEQPINIAPKIKIVNVAIFCEICDKVSSHPKTQGGAKACNILG